MKKMVGLLAALTLALSAAACGSDAVEDVAAGDGFGDTVEVHGDWTIDVVDPDGSTVETIEFHNEFVGQEVLSRVLVGEAVLNGWGLEITAAAEGGLCGGTRRCSEDADAALGADGESIVVTADFEPDGANDIGAVFGVLVVNDPDTGEELRETFSQKDLSGAEGGPGVVPVEAGQIVQVEVTYTFG